MSIHLSAGTTAQLEFTCTDSAGEVVDVTGGNVSITLFLSPTSAEYVLSKTGVVTNGAAGQVAVQFDPADTLDWGYRVLWYETLLDLDDARYVIDSGQCVVS